MKRNVPKLRFKGFSDEWESKRLGDFIEERSEKTEDKENYPLYSLTIENGVVPKSDRYEREFLVKKEGNFKIVQPNDFVYNPMNLRFGALAVYKGKIPVSVSGYYNVFNFNGESVSQFWSNYLKTDRMFYLYNTIATGSLEEKKRVHYSQFKELNLKMPKKEEQEKISNFLTKVDKLIEKQEEKVTELEKYKKGMMQKIFSQEIRFKDENGGEYPEWEFKNIEDICEVKTGGTPSRQKKEYWENGTIYWMVSGEVNKRIVNNIDTKITLMGMENSAAKILPIGTVMIALNGQGKTKGTVALLNVETTCNQSLAGFIPNETFNSKYLFYNLQGRYREIRALAGDGERNGLNLGLLREILVQLPSLIEQEKISKFFYKIDSIIEKEKEKLEELRVWKKGLLQGMFV